MDTRKVRRYVGRIKRIVVNFTDEAKIQIREIGYQVKDFFDMLMEDIERLLDYHLIIICRGSLVLDFEFQENRDYVKLVKDWIIETLKGKVSEENQKVLKIDQEFFTIEEKDFPECYIVETQHEKSVPRSKLWLQKLISIVPRLDEEINDVLRLALAPPKFDSVDDLSKILTNTRLDNSLQPNASINISSRAKLLDWIGKFAQALGKCKIPDEIKDQALQLGLFFVADNFKVYVKPKDNIDGITATFFAIYDSELNEAIYVTHNPKFLVRKYWSYFAIQNYNYVKFPEIPYEYASKIGAKIQEVKKGNKDKKSIQGTELFHDDIDKLDNLEVPYILVRYQEDKMKENKFQLVQNLLG